MAPEQKTRDDLIEIIRSLSEEELWQARFLLAVVQKPSFAKFDVFRALAFEMLYTPLWAESLQESGMSDELKLAQTIIGLSCYSRRETDDFAFWQVPHFPIHVELSKRFHYFVKPELFAHGAGEKSLTKAFLSAKQEKSASSTPPAKAESTASISDALEAVEKAFVAFSLQIEKSAAVLSKVVPTSQSEKVPLGTALQGLYKGQIAIAGDLTEPSDDWAIDD